MMKMKINEKSLMERRASRPATRDSDRRDAGRSTFAHQKKPGTGAPLHTKEPVTVASFRTWRGWRENVARNRCLTLHSSKRSRKTGTGLVAHFAVETRLAASRRWHQAAAVGNHQKWLIQGAQSTKP